MPKYGMVEWGNAPRRRAVPSTWREPLGWNRQAAKFFADHGRRQRVFTAELADIFDNQAPSEWRADFWELVRATPNLVWLVLTKRPQNVARMLPADWSQGYANVWLGITAEDEEHYRQRWPILGRIPASLRFVSHEPALDSLGPLDIGAGAIPSWIICGGESGPNRRLFDPQWARRVRTATSASDTGSRIFSNSTEGFSRCPTAAISTAGSTSTFLWSPDHD